MATALKNTETYPVGKVDFAANGVTAIDTAGVVHALSAGTQVHYGDLIKTGNDGMVVISLNNGGRFDLGRNSEALLDTDVLGVDPAAARAQAILEAEALAAALESGADPTELMEATAAGGAPGAGGDDTSDSAEDPVIIDRTGAVGNITAGHDSGIQQGRGIESQEEVPGVDFAGLEETIPLTEPEEPGVPEKPEIPEEPPPVNLLPNAEDDEYDLGVNPDQQIFSLNGDVSANDQETGDGEHFYRLISSPANGALVFDSDGTFTFTPEEGFEGEVTFQYEIVDADGDADLATVTINVTQPEVPEEPGPELVLPEVIPQPVAALDFSKVTGLSHDTMTLSFVVKDASDETVSEGHATFYADENSGMRDFEWSVDSGETLDDGDYSVTFTRVTGDNAVIHNPVFFGSGLIAEGSEVHHIHVHDPHNEGWTESFDFTLTEDVTVSDSVVIGSAADEDLAGTSADNIIFPGAGDDNISGGEGADTFVWNQGDTGEDTVYDFSLDESDRLNIADLLSDENVTAETIHDYVQAVSSGDDLVLTIDPAGDVLSGGEYEIILVGAADLESQSLVDLLNQLQGTEVL